MASVMCAKDSILLYGKETGIIKYGTVYYNPAKSVLQAWSRETIKRYSCKLYRESSDHPRQLVLIETHNCKCAPKDVEIIQLEKVLKVTLEKGLIKEKSLFHIFTLNGKYTLGTDSLEKTEGWIRILNREIFGPPEHNVVYEYRVKVQKNYKGDKSFGSYLLKVYNEEIQLFTPNGLIPTKFSLSMHDIHKVKYHAIGHQDSSTSVTISVKNVQTNNEEVDALILCTKNASDIAKVIKYRKEHLDSAMQGKPGANFANFEDSIVHAEQSKEYLDWHTQGTSITSESSLMVESNQVLKQEKKVCLDETSVKEQLLPVTSDPDNTTSKHSQLYENLILFQGRWSLPLIYNLSTDPSVDDQDGNVWSESFELRAPKRKHIVKKKRRNSLKISHESISNGPLAVKPGGAGISDKDKNDYASIGLDETPIPANNLVCDYVYAETKLCTFQEMKHFDANHNLTQGTAMESSSNEDYVINCIIQPYLKVFIDEEDGSSFMLDDAEKLK